MEKYWSIFLDSYSGYYNYLISEIISPSPYSYFYWLIGVSLIVWILEILLPWRKTQSIIRRDFWLDGFYMFFNFFLFSLIGYNALSNIGVSLFNDFLALFGATNIVAFEIASWPSWAKWLTLFLVADFVQWNIHRFLHRVPALWEFHKVHHSVKEMGFAAQLRFHWLETIVYKTIQYIPIAMIGFGIQDFFVVYMFTFFVGHLNHANLNWDYGPLKYFFNNPKMHIWHHAKEFPKRFQYGMNFGLTLSVWDYLFKTAYIPEDGRDVELGFPDDENYPQGFVRQMLYPLVDNKKK